MIIYSPQNFQLLRVHWRASESQCWDESSAVCRVAGVVVGALAWLHTKTGLGVITYNLGVARVARWKGGLWFVGALGRWYGPFPLKAMAAAMHLVSVERLLAGAYGAVSQVYLHP